MTRIVYCFLENNTQLKSLNKILFYLILAGKAWIKKVINFGNWYRKKIW